jgi:hypothetical protein
MNQPELESIQSGIERRLAAVESLIPARPTWRPAGDLDLHGIPIHVVAGPALRQAPLGSRRFGLLLTVGALIVLILAYGLAGGGGQPSPLPSESLPGPSVTVSAQPTIVVGDLRPKVEPRLTIPVRPKTGWTVVDDGVSYLNLVYLLEDVVGGGFNVAASVFEPQGVFDPVVETKRLPLPSDFIGWVRDHPDLDSGEPVELTVAGLPATAIDVTVTYEARGAKGQTAQFIYDGIGSWNLESPGRLRIVLVDLPDRRLLIVFRSRPEFFDDSVRAFEDLLRSIQFEESGPSP